jgi:glycosyltransferase involved in cell wall biosynthesis
MVMRPSDANVERLIKAGGALESVHLINGLSGVVRNRKVLARLSKTEAIVGLISESPDNRGVLGVARKIKYGVERGFKGRDLDFILAMGQLGVRWYESVGYHPSRIFPFEYVPARPSIAENEESEENERGAFRILYLGQIIERKDGITAMRALAGLPASDWQFEVVGNGPDLERWKKVAVEGRLSGRIHFHPSVNYRTVGKLFESADLFLLPSKWDGWGAVVNEALMCGVPVVCSDRCGAADLLREPWRGSIFKAGSVESLRSVLQEWIERGRNEESSSRIREWSSAIEAPQVAQYLVKIVEYIRNGGQPPTPPWYACIQAHFQITCKK